MALTRTSIIPWTNELYRTARLLINNGLLSDLDYRDRIRPYRSTWALSEDEARNLCWKLHAEFGLHQRYVEEFNRQRAGQAKERDFNVEKRFTIITGNTGNIHMGSTCPRTFYATFAEAEEAAAGIVRNGKAPNGLFIVEVLAKVELDSPPVKTTRFNERYELWDPNKTYSLGDLVNIWVGGKETKHRCKKPHASVCPENPVHGPNYWEQVS